jgi:nicotinamide N-methyltransferase
MAASSDPAASSNRDLFDFKEVQGFAAGYLKTYYSQPPTNDERAAIGFLVRMLQRVELPRLESGLVEHFDAACGPTLHHAIPLALIADALWMGDYLAENLEQVRKWQRKDADAHDWSQYTQFTLACEGRTTDAAAIAAREALTRQKIAGMLHCDFLRSEVLDPPRRFSSVGCFYGTEEVGVSLRGWAAVVDRVARLVIPGGWLFLAVLGETDSYAVHGADGVTRLPSAYLTLCDVEKVLAECPFDPAATHLEAADIAGQSAEGVHKVFLIAARCIRSIYST